MYKGYDFNQQGLWAAFVAVSAFFGAVLKAVQITRRMDRMDDKLDKLADDVAFLRGLAERK